MSSAATLRRQIEITWLIGLLLRLRLRRGPCVLLRLRGFRKSMNSWKVACRWEPSRRWSVPNVPGELPSRSSFLAQMTHLKKVCAWIDVSDTLDPESAAAVGVDLSWLLWVRCGVQNGLSGKAIRTTDFFSFGSIHAPPAKKGFSVPAISITHRKALFSSLSSTRGENVPAHSSKNLLTAASSLCERCVRRRMLACVSAAAR